MLSIYSNLYMYLENSKILRSSINPEKSNAVAHVTLMSSHASKKKLPHIDNGNTMTSIFFFD